MSRAAGGPDAASRYAELLFAWVAVSPRPQKLLGTPLAYFSNGA